MPRSRAYTLTVALAVVLAVAIVVSAGLGAVHLSMGEVLRAVLRPREESETATILFTLRLPRVLGAGLIGAGLSVTGLLFQGLFRNPLADPFVLGASGGAALGGAVAIFLVPQLTVVGFSATALLAFAGALLAMTVVWNLARHGGPSAMENMLLAGFAIGTILNAATSVFQLRQEATNAGARVLAAWLHGEINVPTWTQVGVIAVLEAIAVALAFPLTRRLNTLALGEEYARQLGVHVDRVRIMTVVVGSLLTAFAVSLGGLIGFVGLLVPHYLRMLLGPDHVRLLPASALGGAAFLIVADTIARTIFGATELPVGVLTAFLGGPAFLYLLTRRQRSVTR